MPEELSPAKKAVRFASTVEDNSANCERRISRKNTQKRHRLVHYQLSCRQCNDHHTFMGSTTESDLVSTLQRHFGQVVEVACQKKKSPLKTRSSNARNDDDHQDHEEEWTVEFAQHFAKHCCSSKKSSSLLPLPRLGKSPVREEDVIAFCRQNVKVQVLQRKKRT